MAVFYKPYDMYNKSFCSAYSLQNKAYFILISQHLFEKYFDNYIYGTLKIKVIEVELL